MNRTKYCVLFLSMALAAVLFGMLCYFYHNNRAPKVLDGTLVQNVSEEEQAV